jgi:hypothetical protein
VTTSPLVAALRPTIRVPRCAGAGAQVLRKERPGRVGTGAQVTGIGAQVRRKERPGRVGTGAQVASERVPRSGRNTHGHYSTSPSYTPVPEMGPTSGLNFSINGALTDSL